MRNKFVRTALGAATIAVCLSFIYANSRLDYRFKVHNKSKVKMTKLLASPDGKKYGSFDIGSGIKPGETNVGKRSVVEYRDCALAFFTLKTITASRIAVTVSPCGKPGPSPS